MRAFGSDRLVVDDEGRIFLSSRLPKPNWNPRASGTSTLRAEHPGTAILCEERWYEVVAVESLGQGVCYELAPWPEEHVIRTSEGYDQVSEARRLAEHRGGIGRERRRKTVSWLSVVSG
ncbi:MAG: hypothetical protein JWN02_2357, partial [Acidobacteria bacterium]|nr:hypothetical protein [Acidobacteriota bacterium]